jgi:hypothetical protein
MPKTIVINSSNYLVGSGNTFIYNFPNSKRFAVGSGIGVNSISIYNSIFNITAKRGNNLVSFSFLNTAYTFTIPDGFYSVSDLNYFLQSQMILNNLYLIANDSADFVYFVEIAINSVRYSTSLNFYVIPTESDALAQGYTKPSNATWSYPVSQRTPSLEFNQAFGNLIGQSAGIYPPTALYSSNIQYLSTKTPVISPVDSLIFTCNLVYSPYSIPNSVFYTLPISSQLGSLIQSNSTSIQYNDILPQAFSSLEINIYDQLFNRVFLNDTEMTLSLSIYEPPGV